MSKVFQISLETRLFQPMDTSRTLFSAFKSRFRSTWVTISRGSVMKKSLLRPWSIVLRKSLSVALSVCEMSLKIRLFKAFLLRVDVAKVQKSSTILEESEFGW